MSLSAIFGRFGVGDTMRALGLTLVLMLSMGGCSSAAQERRELNAIRAESIAGVRDEIMSQLQRCWPSAIKLPALPTEELVAEVVVRLGPDGHFVEAPKIVAPKSWPSDPAAQAYLGSILQVLSACNVNGFAVPESYFALGAPPIQLNFNPAWRRSLPPEMRQSDRA
ncbi:MAG: hypothetical protein QM773_02890 [Hyphomonadaceae bacterium]